MRATLLQGWGTTVYFFILSALSGSLGAVLSMIFRMGRNFTTSEAPKALHILEGASRIFAGCLSGLLAAGFVKIGLVLPTFGDPDHLHLAMILAAAASGASERWIPSLIAKLDGGRAKTTHEKAESNET